MESEVGTDEHKLTISVSRSLIERLEAIAQAPELGFGGNVVGTITAILYGGCNFHERRLRRMRGEENERRW